MKSHPQVLAPPKQLTDTERKEMSCWLNTDGWCSACKADDEGLLVVHLGINRPAEEGGVSFALCVACIRRMLGQLP